MDDDHSYYPASTSRAPPPPRSKAPPKKPKAPRPANAWILFRSEQARFIPKGPGAPQQSEVSKMISQMWRDASTEVREEYERRAEVKKQEHAQKYPDYRFQPVKKEDKDRMKEEKKAEREASRGPSRRTRTSHRYAPYAHASTPTPSNPASTFHDPLQSYYPNAVNYQMHGMYGGPTPPMSAASSPESVDDDSNLPETPVEPESDSQLSLPSINDSQDYSTSPEEQLPFDDFGFPEFQQQQPVEQTPYSTAPTPVDDWSFDTQAVNPGYLMLNVPASAVPESQSWATPIPEFDESLQGLMTNTHDPSIFTLTGFDPDTIQTNPQGAINLSVNDYTFDVSLFEGFDFSSVPGLESFDRVYSNGSNASSFDMEQYLNLDPASATIDPSLIPQMPLSQALPSPAPTEPPAPSPYQPPAGAAFASTRRVGGTWRPYRDQSPDAASPLPYGVPAN